MVVPLTMAFTCPLYMHVARPSQYWTSAATVHALSSSAMGPGLALLCEWCHGSIALRVMSWISCFACRMQVAAYLTVLQHCCTAAFTISCFVCCPHISCIRLSQQTALHSLLNIVFYGICCCWTVASSAVAVNTYQWQPDHCPLLHQSLVCHALDIDHIFKQIIARNVDDSLFLHLQWWCEQLCWLLSCQLEHEEIAACDISMTDPLRLGRSADVSALEIVICRLYLLWCSVSCKHTMQQWVSVSCKQTIAGKATNAGMRVTLSKSVDNFWLC